MPISSMKIEDEEQTHQFTPRLLKSGGAANGSPAAKKLRMNVLAATAEADFDV